jgi:BirA family transcriptional regulator, biotin operon repressor / biotin---[acetyl-CoA-carboxylase] ligase
MNPSEEKAVRRRLSVRGRRIPWREFDRVSSTMDVAAAMVEEGWSGWMVISARSQCSGRGTRGREWFSPPGKGLWVSIIMPPPSGLARMGGLTVDAAEALVEALHELTGIRFDIKPPNDVMSRGKKLAGILIESVTGGDALRSLILGMGLDIAQEEDDFRAAELPEATSLLLETGLAPDRRRILEAFLEHFLPVYEARAAGEDNPRPAERE